MSGHKKTTVTISQEEYRRLYEAEKKLEYSAFSVPEEIIEETVQASQQSFYNEFTNIENRQKEYEQLILTFNDQLRDIEQVATQTLVEQQMDYINRIASTTDLLYDNTVDLIQAQTEELENQVIQQHQHLQQQMLDIDRRMGRLYRNAGRLYEESSRWVQDAINLNHFIQQHYNPEAFYPADYHAACRQLELAIQNFNNAHYEAALVAGQQAGTALTELRLLLEKSQAEWFALRQSVIEKGDLLLEKIQSNQLCQAIDMHGELIDQTIRVNDWSNGMLSQLDERIRKIIQTVQSPAVFTPSNDLKHILNVDYPHAENEIETAIREARYQSLVSQLRFNIANLAMLSLIQQGFRPVEGSYQNQDYKAEYVARAVNHDGSEVLIRVIPSYDEPMQNQLHIISNDPVQRSERELKERSLEITQNLADQGLDVTDPIAVTDRDQKARRVQPAQPLRERIPARPS